MKQYVEVHYFVKSGKREDFYRAVLAQGIAEASRAEAGNRMYAYYCSPDNADELLLIELWESEEAVRLHGQTPHFAALGELKQRYVERTDIRRYGIAEETAPC